MKPLYLKGTKKTPAVSFDPEKGLIELSGRSIPENSFGFYQPLIRWVKLYSEVPRNKTTINVRLEYFNTATARCLLELFKKLETGKINGTEMQINWYHENDDEDIIEACETYESVIDIPFKRIEVENINPADLTNKDNS
jgi:hypothetical protein